MTSSGRLASTLWAIIKLRPRQRADRRRSRRCTRLPGSEAWHPGSEAQRPGSEGPPAARALGAQPPTGPPPILPARGPAGARGRLEGQQGARPRAQRAPHVERDSQDRRRRGRPCPGPGARGAKGGAPRAAGGRRPGQAGPGAAPGGHPERRQHAGAEGEARAQARGLSGAEARALARPPEGRLARPPPAVPGAAAGAEKVPGAQEARLTREEGQVHRPQARPVPGAQAGAVPGEEEPRGQSRPPGEGGGEPEGRGRPGQQTPPGAEKAALQRVQHRPQHLSPARLAAPRSRLQEEALTPEILSSPDEASDT